MDLSGERIWESAPLFRSGFGNPLHLLYSILMVEDRKKVVGAKVRWNWLSKNSVQSFLLAGGISTLISLLSGYRPTSIGNFVFYYMISSLFTGALWGANDYLSDYLDERISWLEKPIFRLVVTIVLTLCITVAITFVFFWLVESMTSGKALSAYLPSEYYPFFKNVLVVTFLISLFMHGRAFLLSWRDAQVEAERLKKDQAMARYEALKNQVNPHFLFNSFNVLSTLVHKDADLAEQFIQQLARVYRYVLTSREKEVVPLREELEQLKAYLFLMQIRFGERFQADVRLAEMEEKYVAPLTLQMLVENAIKHNEVSKARPLLVRVYEDGGDIVVENNLQKKVQTEESLGLGLNNIREQYRILSDREVLVIESEKVFEVRVPMLFRDVK